jgi:hypothetical protein
MAGAIWTPDQEQMILPESATTPPEQKTKDISTELKVEDLSPEDQSAFLNLKNLLAADSTTPKVIALLIQEPKLKALNISFIENVLIQVVTADRQTIFNQFVVEAQKALVEKKAGVAKVAVDPKTLEVACGVIKYLMEHVPAPAVAMKSVKDKPPTEAPADAPQSEAVSP